MRCHSVLAIEARVARPVSRLLYSLKTTVDINDTLLANAEALTALQRTSLTRLIDEGLQRRLPSHCPQYALLVRRLL